MPEDDISLTHLNAQGEAHMVDVGDKPDTARKARARGTLEADAATIDAIMSSELKKGDALAVARIAGIMAAKKTSDLIPLCHPVPLSRVTLDISRKGRTGIEIEAVAQTTGKTGVEMEALTAVTAAALTLYDMAKALEKTMVIGNVRLMEKTGGKSGPFLRKE